MRTIKPRSKNGPTVTLPAPKDTTPNIRRDRSTPEERPVKKLFILFIGWVVIVNAFGLIALNRMVLEMDDAYPWIPFVEVLDPVQEQTWNPIDMYERWDAYWHLDIAQNGYTHEVGDEFSNVVFFPLYAHLVRAAAVPLGGNFMIAGWAVSAFFLFLAMIYLWKLVKEFHPKVDPYLPVLLLLIFPTAIFLNAIYTESLFLFLSIASFYYARKGNFVLAGVFGFFAALTRVPGVLLFLPLIWLFMESRGASPRAILSNKKGLASLFLIPLAPVLFFFHHFIVFGNFFLVYEVQRSWGRDIGFYALGISWHSPPAVINFSLDVGFLVFACIATILVFRRLPISYGLYMLATVAVVFASGNLMSIGRYVLVLFPVFILGASLKSEYVRHAWVFISMLLFSMYTLLFVNHYWAG